MHKLSMSITVQGTVTEEQLARMFFDLHAEVNKFLAALPVKQQEIVLISK